MEAIFRVLQQILTVLVNIQKLLSEQNHILKKGVQTKPWI